jgi:hypothetical protein
MLFGLPLVCLIVWIFGRDRLSFGCERHRRVEVDIVVLSLLKILALRFMTSPSATLAIIGNNCTVICGLVWWSWELLQ